MVDHLRSLFRQALVLGLLIIITSFVTPAAAGSFETLYSFCSVGGFSVCSDGGVPSGSLVLDKSGNIYGTTTTGGANGKGGVVYKLTPGSKTPYHDTLLYSFCSEANCADGQVPASSLIIDAEGNLYGTTVSGGANNSGTVFELSPSGGGYQETVLYNFCSAGGSDCTDGKGPWSGVVADADGDLFGTANTGGANQINSIGAGVVFELIPNESKTAYTETVLYNFCSESDCSDGITPYNGLLMDQDGDLFGTTDFGGSGSDGVVYELIPNQTGTAYSETTLYSFCSQGGSDCTDGNDPGFHSPLIADSAGGLYGVTVDGGGSNSGGVVFKLTPNQGAFDESVIYAFCRTGGSKCTDGNKPGGGLIIDSKGNLYGTTSRGGTRGDGTLFKLTPNKKKTAYTEKVLHSFCTSGRPGQCLDGLGPLATLATDKAGNLYGITNTGGAQTSGTAFKSAP